MNVEDHDLHDLPPQSCRLWGQVIFVQSFTEYASHRRCSLGLADDEDDDITYFHICLIDGFSAANHLQVCDRKRRRKEMKIFTELVNYVYS